MTIEFQKVIRGVEVTIHAASFTSDPDVGLELGPEEVWATLDDKPFELTDEEIDSCVVEATERYTDSCNDDMDFDLPYITDLEN